MVRAWILLAASILAIATMAVGVGLRPVDARPPLVSRDADEREPCFGDLPDAPAALRDLDRERSASLHRELQQNVSLDEDTVMSVITLSRATGIPVALEEVANRTTHRFEVCAFDLAIHEGNASYAIQRVVAFRVTTTHTASLDRDTAMRAVALNASGVPVDPHDVITFTHDERTERAFDQVVDSADVLKLVMAKIKQDAALAAAGAPPPPKSVAPPSEPPPTSVSPAAPTSAPATPTTTPTRTTAPPRSPLGGLLAPR